MNIAALFVILFAFVVTVDVAINVDRFWRIAGDVVREDGSVGEPGAGRQALVATLLVVDLWWPRLLQLFNVMLGLVLVGAMGFTCAQLSRYREMVAILAGGQSLFRVMRPIVVVAIGMLMVQAMNQEFVLPQISAKLLRDHGDAGTHELGADRVPVTPDAAGRLWYARSFEPDTGRLEGVVVWERDESGRATKRYQAPVAVWQGGAAADRSRWVLQDATVIGAEQVGPVGRVAFETDLDPTALKVRRFASYKQSLSWGQLSRLIEQGEGAGGVGDPDLVASLKRTQVGRVSLAAANLLALMMALPFFLRSLPGSMLVQSLRAAPLALVALLGGTLGSAAQVPGLPPEVSVFVPVLVLLPLTVASLSSVQT